MFFVYLRLALEPHALHVIVQIGETKMKRQYQDVRNGSTRDPRYRKGYERPRNVLSLHDIEEFNGTKILLSSIYSVISLHSP